MNDTPFQLFPTLDPATENALRESIRRWGVIVPIVVDQHGQIIDGHHRRRIADELGAPIEVQTLTVESDDDARAIAATLNTDRRHMDIGQRREIVAHLREQGHSLRAIAGAVGVSLGSVRNDLQEAVLVSTPDTVRGADGKTYPATRPAREIEPGDVVIDDDGAAHTVDLVEQLVVIHDDEGDAIAIDPAAEFVLGKRDLGGGISHPARYPNALIPLLAAAVPADEFPRVLDPFAGTGRIHELPNITTGIEIEPEWAALHPETIVGSALDIPFGDSSFDAIVTSPTYGNRLADKHNASDPERRHSYTFDLGRQLNADNAGGMQWGDEYREFHVRAWQQAERVLRPGGRFVLNIKDHIRRGSRQYVSAWHVNTLYDLGLRLLWVEDLPTRGLPHVNETRPMPEQVFVMVKL